MQSRRPIVAETTVRGDAVELWRHAQTPALHERWDARFTSIEPIGSGRFRYATRLGFGLAVAGWGETRAHDDGCGSTLRFGSERVVSLVRDGAGHWRFELAPGRTRFRTAFDYRVRWGALGRALDRLAFRPLFRWATRWSFDRLRLWIERGQEPEASRAIWLAKAAARTALGLVWLLEGIVPKLLAVAPSEIELVRRSRLFWPTPEATLAAIGIGEALVALWILSGRAERAAAAVAALGTLGFTMLCVFLEPGAIADPFGGLLKNFTLLAAAAVVWLLSPIGPKAARARGARRP
jgi:uncharacterized membrane protein YphA (DoxX/SURF4 family)